MQQTLFGPKLLNYLPLCNRNSFHPQRASSAHVTVRESHIIPASHLDSAAPDALNSPGNPRREPGKQLPFPAATDDPEMHPVPAAHPVVENRPGTERLHPRGDGDGVLRVQVAVVREDDVAPWDAAEHQGAGGEAVGSGCGSDVFQASCWVPLSGDVASAGRTAEWIDRNSDRNGCVSKAVGQ